MRSPLAVSRCVKRKELEVPATKPRAKKHIHYRFFNRTTVCSENQSQRSRHQPDHLIVALTFDLMAFMQKRLVDCAIRWIRKQTFGCADLVGIGNYAAAPHENVIKVNENIAE